MFSLTASFSESTTCCYDLTFSRAKLFKLLMETLVRETRGEVSPVRFF